MECEVAGWKRRDCTWFKSTSSKVENIHCLSAADVPETVAQLAFRFLRVAFVFGSALPRDYGFFAADFDDVPSTFWPRLFRSASIRLVILRVGFSSTIFLGPGLPRWHPSFGR